MGPTGSTGLGFFGLGMQTETKRKEKEKAREKTAKQEENLDFKEGKCEFPLTQMWQP